MVTPGIENRDCYHVEILVPVESTSDLTQVRQQFFTFELEIIIFLILCLKELKCDRRPYFTLW